jgi:hypothetical protein
MSLVIYVQVFNICKLVSALSYRKIWWLYKTDMEIKEYFFKHGKCEENMIADCLGMF